MYLGVAIHMGEEGGGSKQDSGRKLEAIKQGVGCIRRGIQEVVLTLYKNVVRPHLQY